MLNNLYLSELAFIGSVLCLIWLATAAPASWAWLRNLLQVAQER